MKRYLLMLGILLGAMCTLHAQEYTALFTEANKAYTDGQYEQALEQYNQILSSGQESAALYYNLGNTYYRLGEIGQALLYYERAHRLKPNDKEINENIAFAYSRTEDKIETLPQFFLVRWCHALVQAMSVHGWMWVCLILLAVGGASLVLFTLAHSYALRKGSLITTLSFAVLLLVAIVCTISANAQRTSHSDAIVTAPMSVVKSSPSESSVDKFILHEGTKVKLLDELDGWQKIRIADGNIGWMNSNDYTVI